MSVSPRRGAIFEEIMIFRGDSVWDMFLMNFGWCWEPFGHYFDTKLASKKRSGNRSDLRWILEGFLFPNRIKKEKNWVEKSIKKQGRFLYEKGDGSCTLKSRGRGQRRDSGLTFFWRKD